MTGRFILIERMYCGSMQARAVLLQHDAILVPDQIGEEAQIAAQVEDAGHA